jgi:hypothetical protein
MGFLIGALIIGAVIAVVVHRGLQMKNLANDGIVGEGKVLKKFKRLATKGGNSSPYLRYEFYATNGIRYERQISVGEEIYGSYEEGDAIDVVYLSDKPKVNAAKYMVNLSREALKLPPL